MRCKKCKRWLPFLTRYCSKCGQQVAFETRLKSEWLYFLMLSLTLVGMLYASYVIGHRDYSAQTFMATAVAAGGLGLVLVIAIVVVFCFAFVDLVRLAWRSPKFIPLPLAVLALVAGGGYAIFVLTAYSSVSGILPLVQDNLAEAAAAKLMGDKLARSKTVPAGYSWEKVQASSERVAQVVANLPVPDKLDEYQKSVVAWAAKMADESKDKKDWTAITDEPSDFELALNQRSAAELFNQSLERIAALKEFGDTAIKQKDMQAVRYIAARLMVQKHWLRNLVRSRDPGWFASGLVEPALAAEERRICVAGKTGKEVCAASFLGHVELIHQAALDVLDGRDKAEVAWQEVWDKAAQDGGLALPEPTEAAAKYSPTVQAFIDGCYERGGELGEKLETRDQLPMDENGRVCTYQKAAGKCWDYLTNSGGRYGGGESGCPKQGIIPEAVAKAWFDATAPASASEPTVPAAKTAPTQKSPGTPAAKPKAASWDGNYAVSGVLDCSGSIPGTEPKLPVNSGFTVSGNALTDLSGAKRAISDQGTVTIYSEQIIQGINGVFKTTYHFVMDGGIAKVSGNASVDMVLLQGATRYESRCAGMLSGVRR
jgi:hypothetical protein